MSGGPARGSATLQDFFAIPEAERFHELVHGEIVRKATPSGEHGGAQGGVLIAIGDRYQRPPGSGGPGGWWLATEVEIAMGDAVLRPDLCGWRRERSPKRPTGSPVTLRPDWVCEVISKSNANHDTVKKLRLYHGAGVPHYWLVDPRDSTLTVLRWNEDGYVTRVRAERDEIVRPEPFEAVELRVGVLFGDDPSE